MIDVLRVLNGRRVQGSVERSRKRRGEESAKTKLAWYKLSGMGGAKVDVDGAVKLLEERVKGKDG